MAHEAECRLNAALKRRALGKLEGVTLLGFEQRLHKGINPLTRSGVPADMCGTWNLARAMNSKELAGKDLTPATLKAALTRKNEACCEVDATWCVDSAYFSSFAGTLGEKHLAEMFDEVCSNAHNPQRQTATQVQQNKTIKCCNYVFMVFEHFKDFCLQLLL